jgi:hypothetical protein
MLIGLSAALFVGPSISVRLLCGFLITGHGRWQILWSRNFGWSGRSYARIASIDPPTPRLRI